MKNNPKILAVIPARSASKRIPNKNIKIFCGKPLVYYAVKQALTCGLADRVIVDTDSEIIARIARKYGAEVPWLRPQKLAQDKSQYVDSLIWLLGKLRREQNYVPDFVMILQTTSPLREVEDIWKCWELMQNSNADTLVTITSTHPRFYYLDKDNNLLLVNKGNSSSSSNVQDWRPGFILNGNFVDLVKTKALLQAGDIFTKKTKGLVCDKWRSIDLDTPEDWILAELLYKNKEFIKKKMKKYAS